MKRPDAMSTEMIICQSAVLTAMLYGIASIVSPVLPIAGVQSSIINLAGTGLIAGSLAMGAHMLTQSELKNKLKELWENTGLAGKKNNTVLMPKLMKEIKTPYGYHLIFYLPPGFCKSDIDLRKEEIETALRAEIETWQDNGTLHMRVMDKKLPSKVKFMLPENWSELEMTLPLPIGFTRAGFELADLVRVIHLLVGGEIGAGKSNFLHQAIAGFLQRDNVKLFLIDLKRVEFAIYSQHAAVAYTLHDAIKILRHIRHEVDRRMELLDKKKLNHIRDYKGEDMPYWILIVDEMSQLSPVLSKSKEDKRSRETTHRLLTDIVVLSRALGIHCILCTQRPDRDIIPGQLKSNLPGTLAFRVRNKTTSEILECDKAHLLPRIPGRAIYKYEIERETQVMHLPFERAKELLPEEIKTKPIIEIRKKDPELVQGEL